MSGWVVALVLSTAILHASWNAVLRHGRDGLWTFTLIMAGAAALSGLCLPFLPLPDRSCLPFLAAAFLLHGIYSVLLIFGYRWGELGAVYPIARGTAPLLVSAGAALFAGERLSLSTLAAIALVSLGIVGLSRDHLASAAPPRALAIAVATGIAIASYSVVDGMGARVAGNAISYAFWLAVLDFLPWPLVLVARRGTLRSRRAAPGDGWRALAGGAVSIVAYALVLWAMTLGALGIVSALRETSVVFAALVGWLFLGERLTVRRLAASGVIAAGILALALPR
jgi:drug/metabolite transporter (DMT)-like permease